MVGLRVFCSPKLWKHQGKACLREGTARMVCPFLQDR